MSCNKSHPRHGGHPPCDYRLRKNAKSSTPASTNAIPRCSMSLCRCWETSNRLRLRRRLTVVRNSSPGSNILKTNLPSTPSAIRWPITTSLGYGQSSGLQTCAGDGARGLDQVGLQHRLHITGLSMQNTDSASKRLELLREVVVGLRRLAILTNVSYGAAVAELREAHATARASGLEVITLEIQRSEDVAPAFEALNDPIGALYVCSDPLTLTNRIRINTLALSARLPTIYGAREFVEAGGLMSYGANFLDLYRRSASYVDKILRGTKPADIPVEQPTKFD